MIEGYLLVLAMLPMNSKLMLIKSGKPLYNNRLYPPSIVSQIILTSQCISIVAYRLFVLTFKRLSITPNMMQEYMKGRVVNNLN